MMNHEENEKTFDHAKAGVADKLLVLSELEHTRRHALRGAVATYSRESDSDSFRWVVYLSIAKRARDLRRLYQKKNFGDIVDTDWCLCKSSASLRQLVYETAEDDIVMLQMLDELVDDIWELATGLELSDCVACKEDAAITYDEEKHAIADGQSGQELPEESVRLPDYPEQSKNQD